MARTIALSTAEVDRLADEIAELSAQIDAAAHRLLALIRRFDAAAGWADQGALSCAHWLSWRIGLELGAAREHVRVARALGSLPAIGDALRRGQVSYSKVRALTRVATPASEASLLAMARSSTASQLERICRGYRRALRGLGYERPEDELERRYLRMRETESGLVRIEAQLTAEEAAVVRQALELAAARAWRRAAEPATPAEPVPSWSSASSSASSSSAEISAEISAETPSGMHGPTGPSRTIMREPPIPAGLRRADALVALCESHLTRERDERRGDAGPPVEIVVHVEADTTAGSTAQPEGGTLDDGTPLPRATAERLACDATVVRVLEDSRGNVLDVGRRRRTIPGGLRRALRLRDRGCRFPGCTNQLTDGHHVVPWSRGGETKLTNLVSLCRRHHRFVHELGFRIERVEGRPDGVAFFRASGIEVRPCGEPPPQPVRAGESPLADLLADHHAAGIAIDPDTSFPDWDGTRPDYDHIVACLVQGHEISATDAAAAG
jgi:Domain of unknown function (DUF222)/HNH endonuclease